MISLLKVGDKPVGTIKLRNSVCFIVFGEKCIHRDLSEFLIGDKLASRDVIGNDVVSNSFLFFPCEDAVVQSVSFRIPGPPVWVAVPSGVPAI
jgi:hypothetical protein